MRNKTMSSTKRNILVTLIIGLSFLWTGSAFLSWVYNVAALLEPMGRIDLLEFLTEGIGYIFQAIGILVFSLFIRYFITKDRIIPSTDMLLKWIFLIVSIADVIVTYLCMKTALLTTALIFGYTQNILHGVIAAMYIYMLTLYADMGRRGIVFGLGYSIGSIGSYLISLINSGNFLTDIRAIAIYAGIVAISIALIYTCSYTPDSLAYKVLSGTLESSDDVTAQAEADPKGMSQVATRLVWLAAAVVVLLSLVKGIGYYFDFSDVWSGGMSLEYTRMYYAVGLIFAGIVNDINRRWGGMLCVAGLIIPFVLIMLNSASVSGMILWIINYALTGLYVVYRVLLFSDISWESFKYKPLSGGKSLFFVAPFGLMYGRTGDLISTTIGIRLATNPVMLNSIAAIMFVITVIVFMALFVRIYIGAMTIPSDRSRINGADINVKMNDTDKSRPGFTDYYGLTDRETLVLFHITNKLTNKEIAAELFVQESTVKYHVKNILRKTGCSNRRELCALYDGYEQ